MDNDYDIQMEDDDDQAHDFSLYSTSAGSIADVKELQAILKEKKRVNSIRIMHSINLKSMQGLEKFVDITELNLSSNSIDKMDFLYNLHNLKILNLSCNRIRVINCLDRLYNLEKLILASNRISSLQNLKQLYGDDYSLKYLDIRDNKLADLNELKHLQGLSHIQELSLVMEDETNPIFSNPQNYLKTLKSLPNSSNFIKIDGNMAQELFATLKEPNTKNINSGPNASKQKVIDENDLGKTKENMPPNNESGFKNEGNLRPGSKKQGKFEAGENPELEKSVEEVELYYKKEIQTLHSKLQALVQDQKELIYKFEYNEKYWSTKCGKLEENLLESSRENKDLLGKMTKLTYTVEAKNKEIEELNNTITMLRNKKDKKEDLVDALQNRVENLLKENAESQKEISMRIEEISRLKENLLTTENRVSELKAIIRENEKNLNDLHARSLENANVNLLRAEEIQRKYDELNRAYDNKIEENKRVCEKNVELIDLIKEWEKKFDDRVGEVLKDSQEKAKYKEEEYIKELDELENRHRIQIEKNEDRFKENMDLLEEEFKKVLLENNDKFKQLKSAYDEKCKIENEMKQLLKLTVAKNTEMEKIIAEQSDLLKKVKKEYTEVINEKESLSKNTEGKLHLYKADITQYQSTIDRLEKEKDIMQKINKDSEDQLSLKIKEIGNLKRSLLDYQTQNEELTVQLEKTKSRLKTYEDKNNNELQKMIIEIEDLKDTIATKNKMLEDKNLAISQLKEQLTSKDNDIDKYKLYKDDVRQLEDELEKERHANDKLRKKIDKQSEYINELEEANQNLKEEISTHEELINDLKEKIATKNQALEFIEDEIKNVKNRHDKEGGLVKEKDKKINELENLIVECRESLQRKIETIKGLEEYIKKIQMECETLIKTKDKEIHNMKRVILQREEELKALVIEYEKYKKKAKQSIIKMVTQELD